MAKARQAQRKRDDFQRWLFFVVFVSVLPLVFSVVWSFVYEQPIDWITILGKGELLASALAIFAEASGDLIGQKLHGWRLSIACFCVIMAATTAGVISIIATTQVPLRTAGMTNFSIGFFLTAVMAGVAAKVISED